MWIALLSVVGLLVLGFAGIWTGIIGYVPDMEDLQTPINYYASQVYSDDGKQLGTYAEGENNRIAVNYSQISPYVVQALVSTEDERFYNHSGIDFIALSRAIVKRGIMGNKGEGGGSTITQQLAKQLYSERAHSTFGRLIQKPVEWVIAVKLERHYTKKEIIAMYLNQFDFLYNAVGIKSAADTYFGKEPKDLNLGEAALLVGMCQNPSYFNPKRYPQRAMERRNLVLGRMEKNGYITHADYELYASEPIEINFHRRTHLDGQAPYFREFLRRYMTAKQPEREDYAQYEEQYEGHRHNWLYSRDSLLWEQDPLYGWCNKNFKRNGEPYNIYTDGLRIYTTLDTRMQKYAEEAVEQQLARHLQPIFNADLRTMRNAPYSNDLSSATVERLLKQAKKSTKRYWTLKERGASDEEIEKSFNTPTEMTVFTYRGERDTLMSPMDSIRYYKRFIRASLMSMEANTGAVKAYVPGVNFKHFQYDMCNLGHRQVGSTIKPYLYACYLANNDGTTPDSPMGAGPVAGCKYRPKGTGGGSMTLKAGLARSHNGVSHNLIHAVGPVRFWDFLRTQFNIFSMHLHAHDPLCLGSCEVSVSEMVSAYSAFANKGIRCLPMYVTRIEDNDGNVIAEFTPVVSESIPESVAYKMLVLMKGVVDSGTGRRVRSYYDGDMGGKTGTTNSHSDAWFMGVTPQLVNGCWVGGEERGIHFTSMSVGQGAAAALPIWGMYMKKVTADSSLPYKSSAKFDIPKDFNAYDDLSDEGEYTMEDVYE